MMPFSRISASATGLWSLLALCAVPASYADILNADDASDVCSPGADPCVINQPVQVVSGSRLDFGRRALRIQAGGRIELGAGAAEIACGSFSATTPGAVAILARGRVAGGGQDGGAIVIESRGSCALNRFVPCFFDGQCGTGPCLGTTCASAPEATCNVDADCDLGACNAGGGVLVNGAVEAQGEVAGSVSIMAAGDVAIVDVIDVDSTDPEGDGGQITITSVLGAVSISGRIEATSGRLGFGGVATIDAATDVSVSGIVDVSGGDFDGGELDILAGADVVISGALRADAKGGEGAGGFIGLDAGNDVILRPAARLTANGHRSADNFGGDGGSHTLASVRHVIVEAGAVVEAGGAKPDGFAGDIDIIAEADVVVAGTLETAALGSQGGGGDIDVTGCAIEVTSAGAIENVGDDGSTVFTARTRMTSRAGSRIAADKINGSNMVFYRDAARPPSLEGSVQPAAVLVLVPALEECVRCGNGVTETGETCDDENVVDGDGCSASCQDELCIAETENYPADPLCDDGNVCTEDACANGVGCEHQAQQGDCEDGIDCTANDACLQGRCRGVSICGLGTFCSHASGECVSGSTTTTSTLPGACGDGFVDGFEDCDDGDDAFVRGEACSAECSWIACGDPDGSGAVTASDSLTMLRVAVGLETCAGCVCDVDASSGTASASDALRTLRAAVGLSVSLQCPACTNP